MSQVRENSKGEEHVQSSAATSTTTTTSSTTTTNPSNRTEQLNIDRDMEITITIPPGDSTLDPKSDRTIDPKNYRSKSDPKFDPKTDPENSVKLDRKNDSNIDPKNYGQTNDPNSDPNSDLNNDDSDPPVENYIFQEEEEEFHYEDEDESFLVPEDTHHNLLTAQEQRMLQKKRAQSAHYRKRKKSANIDANYVPPYAKKRFRRQTSVLPSKFLLGGNIRDPLNLASLADAKVNAALNAETPKSSPLPVPMYRVGEVPVFIPKNPDDPLGLQSEASNPHDFIAGIRKNTKGRKHRHRKKGRKRTDSECSVENCEDSDGKDKDTSLSSEEELKKEGLEERSEEVQKLPGTVLKEKILENKESAEKEQSSGTGSSGTSGGTSGESKETSEGTSGTVHQTSGEGKLVLGKPGGTSGSLKGTSGSLKETSGGSSGVEIQTSGANQPVAGPSGAGKSEISAVSTGSQSGANLQETTSGGKLEGNLAGTSGVQKRKSKPRKRTKKSLFQRQFHPGLYLHGKTSEYVPLGTPSVHEPNLYQYSPAGGPEYYNEDPFESPSITAFVNQEPGMEPFSPPPKPEVKKRRLEVETSGSITSGAAPPPEVPSPKKPEVPVKKAEARPVKKPEVPKVFLKPAPPTKLFRNNMRKRFRHKSDPIVSPVVPQPGSRRRFPQYHFKKDAEDVADTQNGESSGFKYRKKDAVFQYGNYNRYYGYRITDEGVDLRLSAFPKEIFESRDVLDVGCNIGHVTMLIARDYGAKRVVGIDIDPKLIEVAKKNVKHYVDRDPSDETIRFPHSCPLMYGVLQPPPGTVGDTRKIPFPYNVSFRQENYVLESDELLETVRPEFDLILCLSITKWIHLNSGDDGLKRFFRRAFLHLRPGGKLILEPQPWSSYKRKKKLTEKIFETFKAIRFYPDKFQDYLLKEVGFSTMEKLTTPTHSSKGFQRPLMVFTKAEATPRRSPNSNSPTQPQLGLVEMITTSVPAASPASLSASPAPAPEQPLSPKPDSVPEKNP